MRRMGSRSVKVLPPEKKKKEKDVISKMDYMTREEHI
jgi:hypothetical protein